MNFIYLNNFYANADIGKKASRILLILFLGIFFSCKRDLGTTKLGTVSGNDLIISGINDSYLAPVGDTVKIAPVVKNSDGASIDTSEYTVTWIETEAGGYVTNNGTYDTITTNNFVWPITFSVTQSGENTWIYRVTNKQTGIFTQKQFTITTYAPTTEGFYVLSQTGINQSKLGMIYYNTGNNSYDTSTDILADIYSAQHIPPAYNLRGNPISVNYGLTYLANFFLSYISIITDQDGILLAPSTLLPKGANGSDSLSGDFSTLLGSISNYSPAKIKSLATSISAYAFNFINYDGYIYNENYYFGNRFNSPLTIPGTNTPINASKWIGYPDNQIKQSGAGPFVFFDVTTQSFYYYYYSKTYNLPIANYTVKNKLLYCHYTDYGGGRYYAVMQSNNNDSTYLLSFDGAGNKYAYNFLSASSIDSNTHFAISAAYGYLFYNIGSDIYEYDIVKEKSFLMTSYSGKSISFMEGPQILYNINAADRTVRLSQSILIASYDPSNLQKSGTVDIYNVPSANGQIQKQNSYNGFGKVVSVSYKQNAQ